MKKQKLCNIASSKSFVAFAEKISDMCGFLLHEGTLLGFCGACSISFNKLSGSTKCKEVSEKDS